MKKKILIIILSIVLISGLVKLYETLNLMSKKTLQLDAETEAIPVLKPHPHTLGDSILDRGHMTEVYSSTFKAPYDMWVRSLDVFVENADPVIIHHLRFVRLDQSSKICPTYKWQPLFVASAENSARHQEMLDNYRYFLPKGTPLFLYAMVHNPTPPRGPGKSYKNVKVKATLKGENPMVSKRFKPVELYWLHISEQPCIDNYGTGETFDVPPNTLEYIKKAETFSAKYTFPDSGTIAGMGGHIHPFPEDGGKSLDVYINGKPFYTFKPKLQTDESWSWGIDPLLKRVRVKKGDKISISTLYSNPNPEPVRGVMGQLVFYFAKD